MCSPHVPSSSGSAGDCKLRTGAEGGWRKFDFEHLGTAHIRGNALRWKCQTNKMYKKECQGTGCMHCSEDEPLEARRVS